MGGLFALGIAVAVSGLVYCRPRKPEPLAPYRYPYTEDEQ